MAAGAPILIPKALTDAVAAANLTIAQEEKELSYQQATLKTYTTNLAKAEKALKKEQERARGPRVTEIRKLKKNVKLSQTAVDGAKLAIKTADANRKSAVTARQLAQDKIDKLYVHSENVRLTEARREPPRGAKAEAPIPAGKKTYSVGLGKRKPFVQAGGGARPQMVGHYTGLGGFYVR